MVEKYQEEFELIPISPIRRLEKRIEQLESADFIDTKGFLREMVDIIRMNQQLVDELAKANDALRIEISRLPARLEEVVNSINELLTYIKASATEETGAPTPMSFKPLTDKLDQLIEQNKKIVESNQALSAVLSEIGEKLKRPLMPIRKPMLPPKPMPTQ
ncbi:MAG: hypothetical protein QMD12_00955 [Candidatus Aenigmarchaeota archaeon]|nr:hypothetical protein [Candidatus Aenigmarchaeota archaeon]